ncbi:YciI family protein [Acidaminobacter sp.]|uniref:YciI family protein n=1 Tax=Acidaminobacter sp. TaxID=1872102 RepID=UPI0013848C03|nr:YciI family protein [Acidaminobacter sp.]MDK9711663.1 YciI family protein [Acidaminobacter sp.]MZQ98369.1 hypothetical protein [Acidaminobacter sp.]
MILYSAYFKTVNKALDEEIRQAHLDYIYKLMDDGVIVAKGPFTDHSGGLIIYKASDFEEASGYVMQDPVCLHGSRTVEIKEWKSSLEV